MDADELPRVTLAMLRRADGMCPRRLAHEYESGKRLTRLGGSAFDVRSRVVEDATTGHRDPSVPLAQAFSEPTELEPEQREVYRAAVAGYVTRFADRNDAVADVADLGWSTDDAELGIRLAGPVGIPIVEHDGTRLVRIVRIGAPESMIDAPELAFVLARAAVWAGDRLRVEVVDLLDDRTEVHDIVVGDMLPQARDWIAGRAALIADRADRNRARVGADCGSCPCIPGCPPLVGHR